MNIVSIYRKCEVFVQQIRNLRHVMVVCMKAIKMIKLAKRERLETSQVHRSHSKCENVQSMSSLSMPCCCLHEIETIKPLLSTPLLRDLWISLSTNAFLSDRQPTHRNWNLLGAERRLFALRNFKEKQTNKTIKHVT